MTFDSQPGKDAIVEVKERSKPTLVALGNRYVSSDGRWHHSLMADHLLLHGRDKWWTVGELAKIGYGANTIGTKCLVRARLPGLFNELLSRGFLLVREFDGQRVAAVKIYDPTSEHERQSMALKLSSMRARKELSERRFEQAIQLLSQTEEAGEP